MNRVWQWIWLPCLLVIGALFAWRLQKIPSRQETAAFFILCFVLPTLKWPKFGAYYLFFISIFIPLGRRMYYLVNGRPPVDYLMLIGDGVMVGFICALILLWILNREKVKEPLTLLVLLYASLLFVKVFFLNQGSIEEGLYGFKFNGLYVLFYFAGSYVIAHAKGLIRTLHWASFALMLSALWSIKQVTLGFSAFEQKWLDSITFTTLRIEGVVRPFGTFVSPAAMADAMCLLLMLGAFYIAYRRALSPLWGFFLVCLSIMPLLIATVRTSWVGAAAGLFFFCFYLRIDRAWIKGLILSTALIGLIGVLGRSDHQSDSQNAALSAKISGSSLTDVMIRKRTAALANPLQEYSVRKRMQIWTEIWYYALQKPLGRGQGTQGYAHSYYFQVLGEIGFPGIFAFLGILVFAFIRGFQVLRLKPARDELELARLFLSILFMFSILNLTGTHLHTNPGDLYFWFSVGGLAQLYRDAKARPSGDASARPEPIDAASPPQNRPTHA